MLDLHKCSGCTCGCWPVSASCIIEYTPLKDVSNISNSNIIDANTSLSDVIGDACFEDMCEALSSAISSINADGGSLEDYLAPEWVSLLSNRYFKYWYVNEVAYSWIEGTSITEIKAVGLVTTKNEDEGYENSFSHAGSKERDRLAATFKTKINRYKNKFLETFWYSEKVKFKCFKEADCHCPLPKRPKVSLTII